MKSISVWSEVLPGNIVQHKESGLLYLAISDGMQVDGAQMKLVHADSYIRETDVMIPGHESEYVKLDNKVIHNWSEVNCDDLVVCAVTIEPGCVNVVAVGDDGNKYLASKDFVWPIHQFNPRDWKLVDPDCKVAVEGA